MPTEFIDPYLYPGTRVFRNIPGIRDRSVLADFEYEQTALRIDELREKPIAGTFDLSHLKKIHGYIFQDVYEWAGQVRTVNILKGGDRFAPSSAIERAGKELGDALAQESFLQNLEKPGFVEHFARHFAEWNALHPFREGNGRATREMFGQLANLAGYELDQTRIDNSKDQWNEASRQSFRGELEPLKDILNGALRPSRAIAFEKLPEAEAEARFPELRRVFVGLHAIETMARTQLDGKPEQVAAFMREVKVEFLKGLDTGQLPDRTREPSKDTARAPTMTRDQSR